MAAKLSTSDLIVSLQERVLTITFNRPRSRNALTQQMVEEVTGIFENIDTNAVRVVVLRGAGGNFCAGGDLKDMALFLAKGDHAQIADFSARAGRMFQSVYNSKVAVVAAVEGAVMGGGFGLTCAADVVIAKADAKFGLPESALGLVPAQIAPYVVKRVGPSYARMLAVCGGAIDANRAVQIGLVHHIADGEEQFEALLHEIIQQILLCAPGAIAVSKQLVDDQRSDDDTDSSPERLGDVFARALLGEEAAEGLAAFTQKRKPQWVQ